MFSSQKSHKPQHTLHIDLRKKLVEWKIAKQELMRNGFIAEEGTLLEDRAYQDPDTGQLVTPTYRYMVIDEKILAINKTALGQGSFGQVFYAEDEDGRPFAVKRQLRSGNISEGKMSYDLNRSLKEVCRIEPSHDGWSNIPAKYSYIAYYYLGQESLLSYLSKIKKTEYPPLSVQQGYEFCFQLLFQSEELYQGQLSTSYKPVIHGDIAPRNIVIDHHTQTLQMVDFGLSEYINLDSPYSRLLLGAEFLKLKGVCAWIMSMTDGGDAISKQFNALIDSSGSLTALELSRVLLINSYPLYTTLLPTQVNLDQMRAAHALCQTGINITPDYLQTDISATINFMHSHGIKITHEHLTAEGVQSIQSLRQISEQRDQHNVNPILTHIKESEERDIKLTTNAFQNATRRSKKETHEPTQTESKSSSGFGFITPVAAAELNDTGINSEQPGLFSEIKLMFRNMDPVAIDRDQKLSAPGRASFLNALNRDNTAATASSIYKQASEVQFNHGDQVEMRFGKKSATEAKPVMASKETQRLFKQGSTIVPDDTHHKTTTGYASQSKRSYLGPKKSQYSSKKASKSSTYSQSSERQIPARSTPKNLSAEPQSSVRSTSRVNRKAADHATAQAERNAARVHSASPQVRWLMRTIPKDLFTAEQYEAIFSSNDPTGKTQGDAFRDIIKTLPADQQERVGEAFARNIRQEAAKIAQPNEPKEVSGYVENVRALNFLASVFTQFVTSPRASKAINFCMQAATASAPLIEALLAGKAATLSMSAMATGGFILAGMAAASMFGLMDDEGSDNGLSALSAQLEAIAASIVQLSQQLVQLGKAIDYRFDELERRLDKQHQETLRQLRVIVFSLDGKEEALAALIRDGHAEMFKRFDALNLAVQAIDKRQTEAVAIGIERQYALDRRLDSLETQWDRKLVLEAGLTATRPLELKKDAPRLSKQLLLSIKNCRGGSASLTGADLPVQLNDVDAASLVLLRERWLTPYEKSDRAKEPETLKRLAGQNIDALVRYAGLQSDYPNLGLLMERVKAFIDFYTAYRDTVSQQIPQEMDQDLRDVIAYVGEVVLKIQAINPREVLPRMFADLVKLNDQALQAIEAEKSTFIQTKKTDSWNRRIQRLEQLKKEIGQTAMPPTPTIPVENQACRYVLYPGVVQWYKGPDYQGHCSVDFPLRYVGRESFYHLGGYQPYHRIQSYRDMHAEPEQRFVWSETGNLDAFAEKIKGWGAKDSQLNSLTLSDHVGLPVTYTQNITQQLAEVECAIAMAVLNKDMPEQLAIYHHDFLKDAPLWKGSLSLGPRLIKPEPGLGIGLHLYCDGAMFDKFVPQQAFINEDNGEGSVCLTYRAWFEGRALQFQLKIAFIPKTSAASEDIFYQDTCVLTSVGPTYNNIEEVIYAWAQGAPIFSEQQISLNCDALDHLNPFYRVTRPQALLAQLASKAVNHACYTGCEQSMNQLAQGCMFNWRKELNQIMLNAYQHYEGSIGIELVKSEALALMIKSLVMMIMPEHHDTFFQAFTDEAINRHRDMLQTLTRLTPELQTSSLKAHDLALFFKLDVKNGAEVWAKEAASVLAGALRVGDSALELQYDALVETYAKFSCAPAEQADHQIVEPDGYETDPEAIERLDDLTQDFMDSRRATFKIEAEDVETDDSDLEDMHKPIWSRPEHSTRRGLFIFNGLFSSTKDNRAFPSYLEKECGRERVLREKAEQKRIVVDMSRSII